MDTFNLKQVRIQLLPMARRINNRRRVWESDAVVECIHSTKNINNDAPQKKHKLHKGRCCAAKCVITRNTFHALQATRSIKTCLFIIHGWAHKCAMLSTVSQYNSTVQYTVHTVQCSQFTNHTAKTKNKALFTFPKLYENCNERVIAENTLIIYDPFRWQIWSWRRLCCSLPLE